MKDQTAEEKLSYQRVEEAKSRIAHALNLIETTEQEMDWACSAMGWNPGVVLQVQEAAVKLGYALATLTRWDEEPEPEK